MAERSRAFDVALLGATGFTGALTAVALAGRAPADLRWALAGRTRAKLEAVRERVAAAHPDAPVPEIVIADVEDDAELAALAASTRVLTSTVGPYVLHGEPVVRACAAAGTDYLDLTGEPEFVDRMYLAHHAAAVASGARLVHACGFDSIPHDLGVQFTVEQLPADEPLRVRGYLRAGGRMSGGTFASAMTGFSRVRQNVSAARERRGLEGRSERVRVEEPGTPHRALDAWAVPLPTIDPQIIGRSARADLRYGPAFSYGHYALVKRLPIAVGGVAGVFGMVAAAQVGPLRRALLGRLPQGDGPSDAQMEKGWFSVRFVGEAAGGSGARVVCEVRGGDPGYRETSRMLADATLCMALDDLPETAGQVTTAQALGPALRARLERSGIGFARVS
ncbi:MAG TPA: saccharopine dehydrogenase NADP-binding domain-containing protein [Baekduia sp.]